MSQHVKATRQQQKINKYRQQQTENDDNEQDKHFEHVFAHSLIFFLSVLYTLCGCCCCCCCCHNGPFSHCYNCVYINGCECVCLFGLYIYIGAAQHNTKIQLKAIICTKLAATLNLSMRCRCFGFQLLFIVFLFLFYQIKLGCVCVCVRPTNQSSLHSLVLFSCSKWKTLAWVLLLFQIVRLELLQYVCANW